MNLRLADTDLGTRIGIAVLVAFALATVVGPLLSPYGETQVVGGAWDPPNAANWLGTDRIGRDMATRILYGARVTVLIALAAALGSFLIGCTLGIAAAVAGGWFDLVATRVVDAVMAFPSLILALIVLSVLGTSIPVLVVVMSVLASTVVFRLSRAVAADINAMEYVEIARLRGEGMGWFLFREILPNAAPTLLAEFGLRFVNAAIFISSLSFLGLGIQPPFADLGGMVRDNALAITFGRTAPLLPAIALAVLAIAVNLIVDGMLKRNANRDLR